jgi:hypothetical protein
MEKAPGLPLLVESANPSATLENLGPCFHGVLLLLLTP